MNLMKLPYGKWQKKRQATYIAPLQPPTLATFLSWEGSAGAGRVRPAGANIGVVIFFQKTFTARH